MQKVKPSKTLQIDELFMLDQCPVWPDYSWESAFAMWVAHKTLKTPGLCGFLYQSGRPLSVSTLPAE